MPLWGRLPGGRLRRKSQRGWEGEKSWNEGRFEEVPDSSDDEGQDVELDLATSQKGYASHGLRFTGADRGYTAARRRKVNAYDEDSDYSEDNDDSDGDQRRQEQHMQIIVRENEDFLVEQALERIEHARLMGKTNVKLSQAEVDALERAERIPKQPEPTRNAKGKKPVKGRPKAVERKRSKSDKLSSSTPPAKAIEPRRKAKSSARDEPLAPYPMAPGPDYGHGSGAITYASSAYHAVPAQRPMSSGSKSASRTASSQSLRQRQQPTPPLPQYQHPYNAVRYFSNPDIAYAGRSPSYAPFRTDPSNPNWEPRARSASNLVPYLTDQPPYGAYQPPAPQFDPRDPRFTVPPGARIASGPPDPYPVPQYPAPQIPAYRHPQDDMFLYGTNMSGHGDTAGEDDDMEDDNEDQGVEIDVVEQAGGSYEVQKRSGAAAAAGNRGRGGGGLVVAKRGKRGK